MNWKQYLLNREKINKFKICLFFFLFFPFIFISLFLLVFISFIIFII